MEPKFFTTYQRKLLTLLKVYLKAACDVLKTQTHDIRKKLLLLFRHYPENIKTFEAPQAFGTEFERFT